MCIKPTTYIYTSIVPINSLQDLANIKKKIFKKALSGSDSYQIKSPYQNVNLLGYTITYVRHYFLKTEFMIKMRDYTYSSLTSMNTSPRV